MPTTPISLEVEDIDFIPVLRVLKNLPGVAVIHFDFDSLGKKRGAQRGRRNGAVHESEPDLPNPPLLALPAPARGRRNRSDGVTGRLVMLGVLQTSQKPESRLSLRTALVSKGFTEGSIDGALFRLKQEGLVKAVGEGVVQITAAGKKIQVPPEALPST